ncbi:MAG: VWA domain-containing protein [Acidobacteriota bacterium]
MRLMSLLSVAVLVAGGLGFLLAEDTSPQEEARVLAVEVPVYVTGPDGRPVSDLKLSEFRLLEDGKPQEIQSADLVVLSSGIATDETAAGAALPRVVGAQPALQRHFVLLFDLVYNEASAIEKARDAAWDMVQRQIPSESPVAVFSITRSHGVSLCTNFTSDRWQIMHALATLGARKDSDAAARSAGMANYPLPDEIEAEGTGEGPGLPGRMRDGITEIMVGHFYGMYSNPEHFVAINRFDRDTYRLTVRDYAEDLRSLASSLNVLPGRKIVLLFSTGFDSTTGFTSNRETELRHDTNRRFVFTMDRFMPKIETAVADAVATAMAAFAGSDCRLYCIDPSGLDASESSNQSGLVAGINSVVRADHQAALGFMASEAGGELIMNTNDLTKPLARVVADTQQYYLLTYTPPGGRPPDAFHQIKVEVTRPGLDISYRRGYYDTKPFSAYTPLEKDLHIARLVNLGVDLDGMALSTATYCFPPRGGASGGRALAVVQVGVPGDQVQHLAQRRVEIYAFAIDASENTRGFFHAIPDFSDDAAFQRASNGGISYTEGLELSPGEYSLKVIVRDPVSGLTGLCSRQVSVPRFDEPRLHMVTPCFVSTGGGVLSVRGRYWTEPPAEPGGVRQEYPLTFRSKPLVAASVPQCTPGASYPLLIKLYDAPIDAATGRPLVRLTWQVRSQTGEALGQPGAELVSLNTDPGGAAEMLFSIRLPELSPGRYSLVVSADDTIHDIQETGLADFQFVAKGGGSPGRTSQGSRH